jgi:hypothetical protein
MPSPDIYSDGDPKLNNKPDLLTPVNQTPAQGHRQPEDYQKAWADSSPDPDLFIATSPLIDPTTLKNTESVRITDVGERGIGGHYMFVGMSIDLHDYICSTQ